MIFTLATRKFNELVNFIDQDAHSLTILTAIQNVSSGAVFLPKTDTEPCKTGH